MNPFPPGIARRLCLPALLILALPLFAQPQTSGEPSPGQPQSLGEIARQLRAERKQSGAHPKVYTNDDLVGPSASEATAESGKGSGEEKPEEPAATSAGKATAGKGTAEDGEAKQEAEIEKREQEIKKQYLDRIAGIRKQIESAKQELERLQRDQIEGANQYRASSGASQPIYEYEAQQKTLTQQMDEQRSAITNLNSQLEDAQEAARHAGVPHATD